MNFRTTLELNGKTATGIRVPSEIVEALGSGKKPAVHVTINGYTYRSTVAVYGGEFMLPVSAEVRLGAGIAAGDEVEVSLTLDTERRTGRTVPPDLVAALDADVVARAAFDGLSYSNRARDRAVNRGRQDGRDAPATPCQSSRESGPGARRIDEPAGDQPVHGPPMF